MSTKSIEFCRDSYKENGEYNDYLMWQDIGKTLEILIRNEYNCSIKYEDLGIYSIGFDYSEEGIADNFLYWLSAEEADAIDERRREKRKEMNWEQNSYEDPLTHLYNRRYAMKTAQEWMERRQEFSFAFIDVDFLKYVTDEMGKLEGNRYLMRVANHLKQSSIPGVLCKTGGNEFMVLCPNVDETKLEHILEMCRETLAKEAKGSSIPYKMGFSYAVVTVDGSLGQDFSSYLETADKKLYEYRKQRKKRL